jgi:hypothetical protein
MEQVSQVTDYFSERKLRFFAYGIGTAVFTVFLAFIRNTFVPETVSFWLLLTSVSIGISILFDFLIKSETQNILLTGIFTPIVLNTATYALDYNGVSKLFALYPSALIDSLLLSAIFISSVVLLGCFAKKKC